MNYCLLNLWIYELFKLWFFAWWKSVNLAYFFNCVMEIVALFSRLSIFYMEIVMKPASLDYSCIQNFETQSFVLWLIFTNGKVDYCLCAFDGDLWTQNVFLLFLTPPLAPFNNKLIAKYIFMTMHVSPIQAHLGLLSPLCKHLQITTRHYGHLPKKNKLPCDLHLT
jgi:hypothetical protein